MHYHRHCWLIIILIIIYFVACEGNLPENIRDFSYNELRSATNNFHASNKIGRGGFGIVYKVITFCIRFILVILLQNLHHL